MNTRQISFEIQGMFCVNCAVTLERALAGLDGVVAARVNYAAERATVTFDPARASPRDIVRAAQRHGFDAPRQRLVLDVADLSYATSARTVERVLERAEGVVQASADLRAQQVTLELLAGSVNRAVYETELAALGLRAPGRPPRRATRSVALRALALAALAWLVFIGDGAYADLFAAGLLPAPLIILTLATVMVYGLAWPFYQAAYAALRHGVYDPSILVASVGSAGLGLGLAGGFVAPARAFPNAWLLVALGLTAGWFIVRAALLIAPTLTWLRRLEPPTALGLRANPPGADREAR